MSKRLAAALAGLLLGTGLVALTATPAHAAAVFTVNSTGDAVDARLNGICATVGGVCTFRAALFEAKSASGHAVINFNIAGAGPHTIAPGSKLPSLLNPAGTTIDGFTDPGSSPNTAATGDNSVITVEFRGQGPNAFDFLTMPTANNVVRGIAAFNWPRVMFLNGDAADNNTIVGNHICTDAAGIVGSNGLNTRGLGIFLQSGPSGNHIGGPDRADRNVISGCFHRGVTLSFLPTVNNVIENNIIGLSTAGAKLPNRSQGVDINYTADNVVRGNVLSGNDGAGIEVSHARGTHNNLVTGNWVGTGINHDGVRGNLLWGIRMEGPKFCADPARPNPGGCTETGVDEGLPRENVFTDNVIVGNGNGGILVDKGPHGNRITGNLIGVLEDGTPAPNGRYGVGIQRGPYGNLLQGNTIAYNPVGVQVSTLGTSPSGPAQPTNDNTITRNSFHDNTGLGIDLVGPANDGIARPVVTSRTASLVTGTACGGCTVEVFAADGDEGRTYLGSDVAVGGTWSLAVSAGGPVTATATNPGGSTSEFAVPR